MKDIRTPLLSGAILAICAVAYAQSAPPSAAQKVEALRLQAQSRKQEALSLARAKNLAVRRVLPNGTVFELMRLRGGRPAYYQTSGTEAADTIGVDELWPGGSSGFGLTGAGVTLGEWDAARAEGTHPEFMANGVSRITYSDSATTVASHSTHVAGIMSAAGVVAAARGMAYTSTLKSYDWNSDYAEMAAAANAGLLASNHSYGYVCGWSNNFLGDGRWAWLGDSSISPTTDWQFGFYSDESRDLDSLLYDHSHYLAVWAAGNSRGSGPSTQPIEHWEWNNVTGAWALTTAKRDLAGGATGYDTLTIGPPVAKNDLVIGAVSPITGGYSSPTGVLIANFSSAGPTDDGRIKPDLASPGVNIYSTLPNKTYGNMSGTSMATPAVTGAIGVLAQQYRNLFATDPLAATMKALLIHTADQVGSNPGPNYRTGWGLVNAHSASRLLLSEKNRRDLVFEKTLGSGQTISIPVVSDGSTPLKATIVWTDPAGTVSSPALNSPTPKLINDLDLRIRGNGQTFLPWILDPLNPSLGATKGDNFRDNVEQVTIPAPVAGTYTIDITAKNASLMPAGLQSFTLIVTGRRPNSLQGVTIPSVLVGDGTSSYLGRVTLDQPATKGGAVVVLSKSGPINIPTSVMIPEGVTYGDFTIKADSVTSNQPVTVTANYGVSKSSSSTVYRPRLEAAFVSQTVPTSVKAGTAFTVKICFRNVGNVSWTQSAEKGYCLYAQSPAGNNTWGTSTINGAFTSIDPYGYYTYSATLVAPTIPGDYQMQWRSRQTGTSVIDFGDLTPSLLIKVVP